MSIVSNLPEIWGWACILFGMAMLIFAKTNSKKAFAFCEKLRIKHSSLKVYEVSYRLGGIVFIIFGLLVVFGVIHLGTS